MKRVTISYSVDLEEVPQRVSILLDELSRTLGGLSTLCSEAATRSGEADDVEKGIEALAEMIRLSTLLEKSNTRVQDCIAIMTGGLKMMNAPAQQPAPPQPQPQKAAAPETKKKKTKKKAKKKKIKKKED